MSDPTSVAQWLQVCAQHEETAELLINNRRVAAQGYFHVGLAVEAALKAYIFHIERPNDVEAFTTSVKTHDLRILTSRAGIKRDPKSPLAPALVAILQWDRSMNYDPKPMPRKVARGLFDAAFSEKGLVTWIREALQ